MEEVCWLISKKNVIFFLFISLELYALCKNANEKNIHCKFILLCTKFFKNLLLHMEN